jgi:hypothetical protein
MKADGAGLGRTVSAVASKEDAMNTSCDMIHNTSNIGKFQAPPML